MNENDRAAFTRALIRGDTLLADLKPQRAYARAGEIICAHFLVLHTASDDKEAVGAVAPELFDQAVFPIEIGLHRAGIDIGALIGPPVAL